MKRYRLTRLAQADIDSAWFHIAKERPSTADRFVARLKSHFETLANNPFVGELRIDLPQDVRQSSVGSYVVLHRPTDDRIEIVRVIHGSRDLLAEFHRPTPG